MIKEFRYLKVPLGENFIQEMQDINDSMLGVLTAMDNGEFNKKNSTVILIDLINYVQSLVIGQRGPLGRTKTGSWCLAPDDKGMDSDARVEFIFTPTYIATATLTRFFLEYPSFAKDIDDSIKLKTSATKKIAEYNTYESVLSKGMTFCTYRGLHGHGYDGGVGAIEALNILSLGKVPFFLLKNPDFCPKLKFIIDNAANSFELLIENGSAAEVLGKDYSEKFRSAIETIHLLNNK